MPDRNRNERMIQGLKEDLRFAIQRAIAEVQEESHKKIQLAIAGVVSKMGFVISMEEYFDQSTVSDVLRVNITFNVNKFKG